MEEKRIDKKERKEQIKLIELKVIKVLKENTNEDNPMLIDELARRVYEMGEEQWKRRDRREKNNIINVVANTIRKIEHEWGEQSPIHYETDDSEELKKRYPSERSRLQLWYCQEFTLQDMNLLLACLMQCNMVPSSEIKVLADKIQRIACVNRPEMYSKLEDIYIQYAAINRSETIKETLIENHLLENLETLLMFLMEPYEGERRKIQFDYCHFDRDGKREAYNKHWKYKISPSYLTFEDGRFWLLGVVDKYPDKYSRYAVDRMKNIEELYDEKAIVIRDSKQAGNDEDEKYVARHMNASYEKPEKIIIKLLNKEGSYNAIYDTFGVDFNWLPDQEDGFERISVIRSPYGIINWALLNAEHVVIETEEIREKIRTERLERLNRLYKNDDVR